ncbi:unnamed protein product [Effrenium voratum]|nr:unnamed protein product [Effrenium voratum]
MLRSLLALLGLRLAACGDPTLWHASFCVDKGSFKDCASCAQNDADGTKGEKQMDLCSCSTCRGIFTTWCLNDCMCEDCEPSLTLPKRLPALWKRPAPHVLGVYTAVAVMSGLLGSVGTAYIVRRLRPAEGSYVLLV